MPLALAYDFYAPFLSATLVTERGERFPFWTADQGLPGVAPGRPYLAELTVKFQLANIPVITARLTPPYEDGIGFLDSEHIEWGTSKLEVQFGYVTGTDTAVLSPIFTGILLKPDIQLGSDLSITLNAQGLSTFNVTSQTGLRYLRGTRRAIVERLLQGPDPANPRPLRLDDGDMARAPAEVRRAWSEDIIEIQQGGVSDWQWILTLVWEVRGYFYMLGDALAVFPRDTRATAQPRKRFAIYHYPDGRLGPSADPPTFPILSVSSPSMGVYLPGYLRGSILQGVNSSTRQVERRVIDDSTVRMGRTGRGGANQAPSGANPGATPQGDGLDVMPGPPADRRLQEQVAAAQQDFAQRAGIKLEIETLGVPDLLPGETIAVRGLGVRLDGPNYMVFDVTHTVGGNGYTTRLTAYANISETWTRAIDPAGPIPARTPTASLHPNADRIEVFSAQEEALLADPLGLPGAV